MLIFLRPVTNCLLAAQVPTSLEYWIFKRRADAFSEDDLAFLYLWQQLVTIAIQALLMNAITDGFVRQISLTPGSQPGMG
jgi:hypothetical protein